MSSTIAFTVRVVCLSRTRWPTVSGVSATWQTVASTVLVIRGGRGPAVSMSPRPTSISSASRTLSEAPAATASAAWPSTSSATTVVTLPEGCTVTVSPTRSRPPTSWPA